MREPPGRHSAGGPAGGERGGVWPRAEQVWPEHEWLDRPRGEQRSELPWTDHSWVDQDAGPVVRPYAVTGGRVHPAAGSFDVVAMVVVNRAALAGGVHALHPEHRAILAYAREPLAVAEVAAHLDLALGVVRVLLGDLLDQGLIEMYHPPSAGQLPSESVLKAVINGLRAL